MTETGCVCWGHYCLDIVRLALHYGTVIISKRYNFQHIIEVKQWNMNLTETGCVCWGHYCLDTVRLAVHIRDRYNFQTL